MEDDTGPENGTCDLLQEAESCEPHHPALLRALAAELGCTATDIADFELNVCDTQPGVIGGELSLPPGASPEMSCHVYSVASCSCRHQDARARQHRSGSPHSVMAQLLNLNLVARLMCFPLVRNALTGNKTTLCCLLQGWRKSLCLWGGWTIWP